MLNKKEGKHLRSRNLNIFKACKNKDLLLSEHFFERWNERVSKIQFETKGELESYIETNYSKYDVEHLDGDHYIINSILGGIYVTARRNGNKVILITTLGTYDDNPVIYNMITSGELNKTLRKYGKINLAYTA